MFKIVRLALLSICAFVAAIIAYVAVYNFVVNNWQQPSRADVSALEQLTEDQIGRVEEAFLLLADETFNRGLFYENFSESHPTLIRTYRGGWSVGDVWYETPLIDVTVTVYRLESRAIERMQSERWLNNERGNRFIEHLYDNNSEAILRHPIMQSTAGSWYVPRNERMTLSTIRVGNVVFRLSEYRRRQDTPHGELSGQFIDLLVEILQESD